MKKTLEDELMNLAHRIIQRHGGEDTEELRTAARQLYEKLTVLSFTENYFEARQPSISRVDQALKKETKGERPTSRQAQPEEKTAPSGTNPAAAGAAGKTSARDQGKTQKPESIPGQENIPEKASAESAGQPKQRHSPDQQRTTPPDEGPPPSQHKKSVSEVDLADMAVNFDDLPQFERAKPSRLKKGEKGKPTPSHQPEQPDDEQPEKKDDDRGMATTPNLFSARPKTKNDVNVHQKSLNQRLNKSLNFGLNDRLAFVNHLFEGNATDFNRVVSQLNTFENFEQARQFLEERVKPDYNWQENPVHERRFLNAVEKKMTD